MNIVKGSHMEKSTVFSSTLNGGGEGNLTVCILV